MEKESLFLTPIILLLVSGCINGNCDKDFCKDKCINDIHFYNGFCKEDQCSYFFEKCEYGCSEIKCAQKPSRLNISNNIQNKDGFSISITYTEVLLGEEKDRYDFYLTIKNSGEEERVFKLTSASLVAQTGIMHDTEDFFWSDTFKPGENKNISFFIPDVKHVLQTHNTTLVIRTNLGNYYYKAIFDE